MINEYATNLSNLMGTHTWAIGAMIGAVCAFVAGGVVFELLRRDDNFEQWCRTIATVFGGLVLAGLWPVVLIALPFAAAAVVPFFVGKLVTRQLRSRLQ